MSTFTSSFHLHSTIFFCWLSTHLVCCSCSSYRSTSIIINDVFELVVLILMTIAVICAYMQTVKLDVNHHPLSKLDDVLLFVAIPAFFLETIFSMLPAVVNGSYLNIARSLLQISQVLIQTPFIIDGLRRCSNAAELRKSKPGRELVIFLTIANVSLWVFYTFSVKTAYTGDERWDIIMWYFFFVYLDSIDDYYFWIHLQIQILWIRFVEYSQSYLVAVDYVLSFPCVCLFGRHLEAFVWASTVGTLIVFIDCWKFLHRAVQIWN